jgi:hypothetical protein
MKTSLVYKTEDFLKLFPVQEVDYETFCEKICVLDIMDRSGNFAVRSNLDDFINRVSKKDDRKQRLETYKQKLYQLVVVDRIKTLTGWFDRYGKLPEPIEYYFDIPYSDILQDDVFCGRTNSKYGKICKNINFNDFYNTKKLYNTDSEYVLGLMKALFCDFKIRNSLVGPAFFDHICNYTGDSSQFWLDFMVGANRASIFNPSTYKSILSYLPAGKVLFAPVMGWNSYQIAYYSSNYSHFVSTDVIPNVVDNGHLLHAEYTKFVDNSLFHIPKKTIDLYCCPSEKLDETFVGKYMNLVDTVLFSPPYYDLELYPSDNQSVDSYNDYNQWLFGYWEQTVLLCKKVLKQNGIFVFVISNYVNKDKIMTNISQDMDNIVRKHLVHDRSHKIEWSAIANSRQSKKTRNGNYEDLRIYRKS